MAVRLVQYSLACFTLLMKKRGVTQKDQNFYNQLQYIKEMLCIGKTET